MHHYRPHIAKSGLLTFRRMIVRRMLVAGRHDVLSRPPLTMEGWFHGGTVQWNGVIFLEALSLLVC